jgi:hypothetical protein
MPTEIASEKTALHHLKWTSPAIIGLLAAALGLIGNFVVAWYNDRNAREIDLEKMRSSLIMQAVNSHSVQQSCQNLLFFIDTALLSDKQSKITQECTHPLQQTYIPALAAATSGTTPAGNDMAIAVKKITQGSDEVFQVAFTVPDQPNAVFNTLKIYCIQITQRERVAQKMYPPEAGNWKPGDRVTFTVDVPKNMADAQAGWHLTFCIGTDNTCYPSPNLLIFNT